MSVKFLQKLFHAPIADNHQEVSLIVANRKRAAVFCFLLPIMSMFVFFAWSFFYTPEPRELLFNHLGGLYRQEDLSKTTALEGELKQQSMHMLTKIFTVNHVSFVSEDRYKDLVSGKTPVSLPDHRDEIRVLFSDEAFEKVIKSLESSPWMADLRDMRKRTVVDFYSPPIQSGSADGFVENKSGKLSIAYSGYFYLNSVGYKSVDKLFRVDYELSLERKPNNVSPKLPSYYFAPLVPDNLTEWRIASLTWTAKKER